MPIINIKIINNLGLISKNPNYGRRFACAKKNKLVASLLFIPENRLSKFFCKIITNIKNKRNKTKFKVLNLYLSQFLQQLQRNECFFFGI